MFASKQQFVYQILDFTQLYIKLFFNRGNQLAVHKTNELDFKGRFVIKLANFRFLSCSVKSNKLIVYAPFSFPVDKEQNLDKKFQ